MDNQYMSGPVISAADVVDKTLIAAKTLPVYRNDNELEEPLAWVAKGDPVGVVYAYLDVNPTYNRNKLWWMFKTTTGTPYYAPHNEGWYDVDALKQQGVLSTKEKAEQKALENMPWYERLIRSYGPWILGTVIVVAAVRGYFSRPSKN